MAKKKITKHGDISFLKDSSDMLVIHFQVTCRFFAVRWCTVSDAEEQKCLDLAGNATARNIRGQLLCVRGQSPTDCMKQIKVVEISFSVMKETNQTTYAA